MRIVVNAFSAKVGGGQTYIKNLLSRLPDNDFLVYIFAPDDVLIPQDQRIIRLTTRFPVINPVARLFWERFVLPLTIKQLKADVLFCPGGIVNTRVPSVCRVVTMFRNMLPFDEQALKDVKSLKLLLKNWLLKSRMVSSMRQADLVIFLSDYARSVVETRWPVKRALTIPHGVPSRFLVSDLDVRRPDLPFSGRYILYVSRFEFYKRHKELVSAYAALPESIRNDYKLLIVGSNNTPSGDSVKEQISELEIRDQVVLLGEYPYLELPALYKHASLFIFISACENCPNILLEAMGAGVPILCSDYQPMPEFGGNAVVYVSPDQTDKIRDRIVELLEGRDMAKELTAKMADQVKLYDWDRTAQKTWDAILSI